MNKFIKWATAIAAAALLVSPNTLSLAVVQKLDSQTECLAKNIYFEARGEPVQGQKAVAQVTINRLRSGLFGNNICEVVYQQNQFSWTIEKSKRITDWNAWHAALSIARSAVTTGIHGFENFEAMYFHSTKIKPHWKKRKLYAKIGNHIFYI